MTLTDNSLDVALHFRDVFKGRASELNMKPEMVFYGDQEMIPEAPAIVVEPGVTTTSLDGGITLHGNNTLQVIVLCYWQQMDRGKQFNDEQGDTWAVMVKNIMNEDAQLDGLVTHGWVTASEPGYAVRARTTWRTTRITWEGFTHSRIGG